jgi:hypothetical protein
MFFWVISEDCVAFLAIFESYTNRDYNAKRSNFAEHKDYLAHLIKI